MLAAPLTLTSLIIELPETAEGMYVGHLGVNLVKLCCFWWPHLTRSPVKTEIPFICVHRGVKTAMSRQFAKVGETTKTVFVTCQPNQTARWVERNREHPLRLPFWLPHLFCSIRGVERKEDHAISNTWLESRPTLRLGLRTGGLDPVLGGWLV